MPPIDLVLDKLEAQVKKFVSRNKEIHRKGRANDIDVYTFEVTEEDGERTITGETIFSQAHEPRRGGHAAWCK